MYIKKNYNINSKKFQEIEPNIHKSIVLSAIFDKMKLLSGFNKLASNPKKTPLNISPDFLESMISIETTTNANYKIMTVGPGNSVNIPAYGISEEKTNMNNRFNINIKLQGFETSNNPIFIHNIEPIDIAKQ